MPCAHDEFSAIFHEVYPKLYRFLASFLSDGGAAAELAQEAFLRLYRTGFERVPRTDARFWLFRVARNMALNELKKREARLRILNRPIATFRSPTAAADPEAELQQNEQLRILTGLLEGLPEHQRAALLLREHEEMSYSEIAHILEISEAKVKIDIFRARQNLRARWSAIERACAGAGH